jgi:hypothetical protein
MQLLQLFTNNSRSYGLCTLSKPAGALGRLQNFAQGGVIASRGTSQAASNCGSRCVHLSIFFCADFQRASATQICTE